MDEIAPQGVRRIKIEAETISLQQAADAEKGTDAAPELADEKPAQNHAGPPDSPGQEQGNIFPGVLGTKYAKQNECAESEVAEGSQEGHIPAVLEKAADDWKCRKEVEPGCRVKGEKDAKQRSEFLHGDEVEVETGCREGVSHYFIEEPCDVYQDGTGFSA